jgi:hypothetical protein
MEMVKHDAHRYDLYVILDGKDAEHREPDQTVSDGIEAYTPVDRDVVDVDIPGTGEFTFRCHILRS